MKTYGAHGFRRFVLCLGYKGDAIRRYFLDYGQLSRDFTLKLAESHSPDWHGDGCGRGLGRHARGDRADDWDGRPGQARRGAPRPAHLHAHVRRRDRRRRRPGAAAAPPRDRSSSAPSPGSTRPAATARCASTASRVAEFNEKPTMAEGWVSGGFFVFQRNVLDDYFDDDPDLFFERKPLQTLAMDGGLGVYRHEGFWMGMDTYRDWTELNQLWDSGEAPWKVWDDESSPVRLPPTGQSDLRDAAMKLLVTGTEGYLGCVLGAELLRDGHDVVGVDTGFYKAGWLYDGVDATPRTLVKDIRHLTVDDLAGRRCDRGHGRAVQRPARCAGPDVTLRDQPPGFGPPGSAGEGGGGRALRVHVVVQRLRRGRRRRRRDHAGRPADAVRRVQGPGRARPVARWPTTTSRPTFLRNATAYGASPRMRFDIVLNNLAGLAWTTQQIAMTSDGTPWRPARPRPRRREGHHVHARRTT